MIKRGREAMVKYRLWQVGDPEPDPDQEVECESMGLSWRLCWKVVREDAISGRATVFVPERPSPPLPSPPESAA